MEITVEKAKENSFKYVDYLAFTKEDGTEICVSPAHTEYNSHEVIFEVDEYDEDGNKVIIEANELLNASLTGIQLCGMEDEEIEVQGDKIYDYIDPTIEIYQNGKYYKKNYCLDSIEPCLDEPEEER